jgi:hypothetical protein
VVTSASDLSLVGPGFFALSISGNGHYSPLRHLGSGTVSIQGLTLQDGAKYTYSGSVDPAKGGCVYSAGVVEVVDSEVKYCSAISQSDAAGAKGGGVYGRLGVSLSGSSVIGNVAHAQAAYAFGGGVYTQGALTVSHSVISGNTARSDVDDGQGGGAQTGANRYGANFAIGGSTLVKYSAIIGNSASSPFVSLGGGLYTSGDATIGNSLIAANAAGSGAGLWLEDSPRVSPPFAVFSSTVSGNTGGYGAGIAADAALSLASSTVSGNHGDEFPGNGEGLRMHYANATLQSSIVSGNTTSIHGGLVDDDVGGEGTLYGGNDLIGASSLVVPPGTLSGDPILAALAYNGGPTATRAISPLSPAFNRGNASAYSYDQRGPGFPRVSGAAADIGAYELDIADLIFADGFD